MENLNSDEFEFVERVKGVSLKTLFVACMACAVSTVVLAVVFTVVQIATKAGFTSVAVNVLLGLPFACLFVGFAILAVAQRRTKEEQAAGYTTSTIGFVHLPQVDPATSLIVRKVGQPLLTGEVKRLQALRIEQVKRQHSHPRYRS